MRNRNVTIWMTVIMLLSLLNTGKAENTYWVGTTGDWFHPANWQYTVPQSLLDIEAYIDNGGTAKITGGSAQASRVYVGYSNGNSGNINHSAGTLSTGQEIYVGTSSGSVGTYNLSGTGLLDRNYLRIGSAGTGTFNQTGGTNSIYNITVGQYSGGVGTYNLSIGTHSVMYFWIGENSGSKGTYNLSGTGQLSSRLYETVGHQGTGTFNQNGGTNIVNGTLTLGKESGSNGRYSISGGMLRAQKAQIGYWGKGRFDIENSAANITILDNLMFGVDSMFTGVAGSTIHMAGASLDNWNTDETDLAGLNNLSLVFEGGIAAGLKTFEVAGQDLGAVMEGFTGNFALDALILGGVDIGQIQLVDWRSNMPGIEALYVKDFVLGNGSYLDLNGLNLYYQNFTNYGGTIDLNGGQMTQVPEPATLLLLGFGAVILRRRKK